MRSHARTTRKARLHVNGGVLIPQRGTFWFPRESEKWSPTKHRRKPARNAPDRGIDNKSNNLYTHGLRVSRALRAPSAPFGRKSPRPFFFPACPPGSPPCCGPGRRRRHRTPCLTWQPTTHGKARPAQEDSKSGESCPTCPIVFSAGHARGVPGTPRAWPALKKIRHGPATFWPPRVPCRVRTTLETIGVSCSKNQRRIRRALRISCRWR